MKKLFAWMLSLFLLLSLTVTVCASETDLAVVIDNAELLTPEEETALAETIRELSATYGMDIVILTEPSLNGWSAQQYADNYYDSNGYSDNGILFLLAMEEREWYFSTCGEAIYVFTDYGIDRMGEQILPYLSEGDYNSAFEYWLLLLPGYFESYLEQDPVDTPNAGYQPDYRDNVVYYDREYEDDSSVNLLIAPVIGLIAAAVTILIMRGQMNTAKRQSGAVEYMKQNSYRLKVQRDLYLYSHVSKTPKPKNNTSHGGSSVHMGGGGRSHGGGGGRF